MMVSLGNRSHMTACQCVHQFSKFVLLDNRIWLTGWLADERKGSSQATCSCVILFFMLDNCLVKEVLLAQLLLKDVCNIGHRNEHSADASYTFRLVTCINVTAVHA